MTEKAIAETDALVRTLNQAGNVGEHEFATVDVDNAKLRVKRGERVVGNFRLGGANRAEKGRLARIRQADNAGIGNELEPQPDCQFDAQLTRIGVTRRAVGRGLEMRIAEAAVGAVPVLAHAGAAIAGGKMLLVAVIDQRVEAVDRLRGHVAAFTAITAVRPAEFNELLPPERDAAIAAIARADVDLGLVQKLHLAHW